MTDLISNCENVFTELLKFSDKILRIERPISDNRLEIFERSIGYQLPVDFKYFLNKTNGFSLLGIEVLGIGDEFKDSSLDRVYEFEHIKVENKMPGNFFPFSPDGRGNHYCLDLNQLRNDVCPVIFWQWDIKYENLSEVEICNDDFISWIREVMIGWTLEEYNYDGTPIQKDTN